MTPQQLAEAQILVMQYAAANEQLKTAAANSARSAWISFDGWYDMAAVGALAAQSASASNAAQDAVTGLSQQYVAAMVASLRAARITIPRVGREALRNGADLTQVHMRAASAYKTAIATGADHATALDRAVRRAEGLIRTDMSLTARDIQRGVMDALGVTGYRRVVHPELSKTGTCGLCIVAADRIYKSSELMPLHPPSCECTTAPIIGDSDPGHSLNRQDLDRFYAEAGSNKAEDLRQTRYRVDEHGEYGPYLSKAENAFRGPAQVSLANDPERAARMLKATLPVLARLEAAGGPEGPLAYQRGLVERLRQIVGT